MLASLHWRYIVVEIVDGGRGESKAKPLACHQRQHRRRCLNGIVDRVTLKCIVVCQISYHLIWLLDNTYLNYLGYVLMPIYGSCSRINYKPITI